MRCLLISTLLATAACAADDVARLHQKLDQVLERLETVETENRELRARIEKLEVVPARPTPVEELKATPVQPAPAPAAAAITPYDAHLRPPLSDPRSGRAHVFGHVAVNSWAGDQNVATRAGSNGTTNLWDSAVGVSARLGDDAALRLRAFTVLPTIGGDGDGFGNARDYAYMRDAYIVTSRLFGSEAVNLRFGRLAYAFGDEYAQFDAPANPLVSHSAAFFWGYDEGFQLFGDLGHGLSYALTLNMDGELGNGSDETASKARGIRIAGEHGAHWHWSASHFNGSTAATQELWMGAQPITRVGAFGGTGAPGGTTSSARVGSEWNELDARYEGRRGRIAIAAGRGEVHDESPLHDREFEWYKVEPVYWFRPRWYAAGRWSEIRVRNPAQGYSLRPFESGTLDLGFDVNSLERLTLGLGYRAGERLTYKLERTMDDFTLIPTALLRSPGPDQRNYTVLQAAAEF